ncbi:MAG: hypothetical protein ACYC3G_00210 [Minisyncoccota bacterium]
MEAEYNKVPDFKDIKKWMELEVKRETIYSDTGKIIVPIGEKRYFREIKDNKIGSGACITITYFEKEPCLVIWNLVSSDKKTTIGYMALRMKNKKWAISNLMLNGISIEKDSNILHIHMYEKEVWIFLKSKKGWCIRKIKKSS